VGCVLAERFASQNKKVLLIDKRKHIAGNCYDFKNKHGVLIHKYGPHYFRTNNIKLIKYLSRFTRFQKANYEVKSFVKGKYYDFPINLNTLEKYFNKNKLNFSKAKKLLQSQKLKKKNVNNFEDYLLSKIGKKLYNDFFKNYTIKQWGLNPKKLSSKIAKRIPLRFDRNKKYINHKYQIMPKKGFTYLFKNMISHPNIYLSLNTDYFKMRNNFNFKNLIYTGPVDNFFNFKFGKLEWRSLDFKFETFKKKRKLKYLQINYPNNFKFTRKVEIKYITKQKCLNTTVSKEFPKSKGDPYYPILNKKNKKLYNRYLKEVKKIKKKNIYLCGRLAEYTYINTDQAIEKALNLFKKINRC
jgi:UDP-galactopyranose mutase